MQQALVIAARLAGTVGALAFVLWRRKHPRSFVAGGRGAAVFVREPDRYPPLPPGPMTVTSEAFLDTDQESEDGPCSYYYAGRYFTFVHGDRQGGGRTYDDTPDEFSIFLQPPDAPGVHARYAEPPYRDPFLAEIVAYLRTHEPERHRLTMLCSGGYVPLEQEKLGMSRLQPPHGGPLHEVKR